MKYTGERVIPSDEENCSGYMAHLSRYEFASRWVFEKKVLDAACGCGYGSCYLSGFAEHVSGIDIDEEAIRYAKQQYQNCNLDFRVMDCLHIHYPPHYFDTVTSFEFIEHVTREEQSIFLENVRKVLKTDAYLIISTPNKKVQERVANYSNNVYHKHELSAKEFVSLLEEHFRKVILFGQKRHNSDHTYHHKVLHGRTGRLHYFLDQPKSFLLKALLPTAVKNVLRKLLKQSREKRSSQETAQYVSTLDFTISNIVKSDDAEYLVAVCRYKR